MKTLTIVSRLSLCVLITAGCCLTARAEVQTLKMPQDYADYCMHPVSGDLAALWAEQGQVHLYRAADLAAKKLEPYAKVRVGTTPSSVCYKRFGDLELFAVVCTQEDQLYLLNAKDGTLYRKVGLEGTGFSLVFSSLNPADPYVYYCHDVENSCFMSVVNLRSMKSYQLFGDAMDGAISATGQYIYRRGAFSPSGFDSLRLVSDFSAEQPEFTSIVDEHESAGAYLPDPFEQYTAAGENLYSQTLEKRVAKLGITPLCFFNTKPLIIGLNDSERERERDADIQLRAVSYNAFGKIGKPLVLKAANEHGGRKDQFDRDTDGELPRGGGYSADYKRTVKRLRLFADDAGDRVVFAYRTRVDYVPLKDFELQPEPLLLAKLDKPGVAAINSEWTAEVKLADAVVKLEFGELPEGMQAEGKTLKWRPKPEQVGLHKIEVKLNHEFLNRTQTFDMIVGYPSLTLPFVAGQFLVNNAGTKALIADFQPVEPHPFHGQREERAGGRLALIETATGKVIIERKLAVALQLAVLTAEHAVLFSPGETGCEVLKLANLEREKSLVTTDRILAARVCGALLVLLTDRGGEIYELGTFKKLRTITSHARDYDGHAPLLFMGNSLVFNGMVHDAELKPQLVFWAEGLPMLKGAKPGWVPPLDGFDPRLQRDPREFQHDEREYRIAKPSSSGPNIEAVLRELLLAGKHVSELSVKVQGGGEGQVLFRGPLAERQSESFRLPMLQAAEHAAFVVLGQKLYRWAIPAAEPAKGASTEQRLQLEPRQSAVVLSGTGTTTLKHQASGGKKPLKFSIFTPYEGIKIDEQTGTVTIEEKPILAEAAKEVVSWLNEGNRPPEPLADLLRNRVPELFAAAEKILGRRPTGIPVALPVRVEVADANFEQSIVQYYVLAEVPSEPLLEHLKKLDASREQAAREAAPREQAGKNGTAGADVQALQRRLDAIEQRLDMNTRALNQVLKQLEQK